jgi:hypothetical protein
MRAVICAVTATIMLGLGMAFLFQATQASSGLVEAALEETRSPSELLEATLESHEAVAAAPDDAVVTTPIAFRQVRSVSIIEPTETAPRDPAAAPAETSRTDYHELEAAPGAALDENRTAAAPEAKAPEATQGLTRPQQPREENVSSNDRTSRKASHRRKHSSAGVKQSRLASRRAQGITTQVPSPAPPALAYTGSNEYQTTFQSVGKVFSGAR